MKQIIVKVTREEALQGYVVELENQNKTFLADGELDGYKVLAGSTLGANYNKTAKGKHLKYGFIDFQRLVKAPKYPFGSFEEAELYAQLPQLLRHVVAMVKTLPVNNPEIQQLVTQYVYSAWKIAERGSRDYPRQLERLQKYNITLSEEHTQLLSDMATTIFGDKCLLNDEFVCQHENLRPYGNLFGINIDLYQYL